MAKEAVRLTLLSAAACVPSPRAAVPCPPAAAPDRPGAQATGSPVLPAIAAAPRAPGVRAFDCQSTEETKSDLFLRAWKGGGPNGAAWNWYDEDLRCTITVESDCDGQASVLLAIGRETPRVGQLELSKQRTTSVTLTVPAKHWQAALETGHDTPYETLLLVARVDGRCDIEDHDVSLLHWSDSFVAGFAGGE